MIPIGHWTCLIRQPLELSKWTRCIHQSSLWIGLAWLSILIFGLHHGVRFLAVAAQNTCQRRGLWMLASQRISEAIGTYSFYITLYYLMANPVAHTGLPGYFKSIRCVLERLPSGRQQVLDDSGCVLVSWEVTTSSARLVGPWQGGPLGLEWSLVLLRE